MYEFIQALEIIDQVAVRKRTTRVIALTPGSGVYRPDFTFEGIDDFNITDVRLVSKTALNKKLSLKRLNLVVDSNYDLIYSDGTNRLTQPDSAMFELTIDNVFYPESGTKCFTTQPQREPQGWSVSQGRSTIISRGTEPEIEVEASASCFGEVLCSGTGACIVDIGAFFIIRFIRESQLCIPSCEYPEMGGIRQCHA